MDRYITKIGIIFKDHDGMMIQSEHIMDLDLSGMFERAKVSKHERRPETGDLIRMSFDKEASRVYMTLTKNFLVHSRRGVIMDAYERLSKNDIRVIALVFNNGDLTNIYVPWETGEDQPEVNRLQTTTYLGGYMDMLSIEIGRK